MKMKQNKKSRKTQNENFKIKISEVDVKRFPACEMKVGNFWKSLYEGNK
jgi:hypothetical protein